MHHGLGFQGLRFKKNTAVNSKPEVPVIRVFALVSNNNNQHLLAGSLT